MAVNGGSAADRDVDPMKSNIALRAAVGATRTRPACTWDSTYSPPRYSIMTALRRFMPTTGELSERSTRLAERRRNLAGSHATYIAAFAAREKSF